MADVSAPSLILFIASLVIAAGVAGVLIDTVSGISNALDERGGDVADNIETDIEIISDGEAGVYNNSSSTVTLLVKNTGLRTLPAAGGTFDVIVDSEYQTNVSVTVVDGNADWQPHGVVEVEISNIALDAGDHRAKVVISGDEEILRFRTNQ